MRHHSLRLPDHEDWHSDPDYAVAVAHALSVAYRHLRRGGNRLANFLRAYMALDPFRDATMSQCQRLHVVYVFALAYAANGDYRKALQALDEALELAYEQGDAGDMLEILHLRGGNHRAVLQFHDAIEDFEDSLALTREERDRVGSSDISLELDLLTQLAGFQFQFMRFDVVEGLLGDARRLTPLAPDARLPAATLWWMEAHLHRTRGEPERALRPALTAAEIYATEGPPISAARIESVAADVVMDLAATLPRESDRGGLLTLAESHIQSALSLAHEARDEIGQGIVLLSHVRHSRLSGRNEDRVAGIEGVVRMARGRDEALLAQALTALGDELASQQQSESAFHLYREAVHVAQRSNLPVYGLAARRALLQESEHHVRD
jgi:tetratricopeptide (TPR) repeat protein